MRVTRQKRPGTQKEILHLMKRMKMTKKIPWVTDEARHWGEDEEPEDDEYSF